MTPRNRSVYLVVALALIIVASTPDLGAQTPKGIRKDQEEGFTIASIPIVQPVSERGVGLALVDRYHLSPQNKTSSSSATGIGGFITGNGSWGLGIGQTFHFKDDRWVTRGAISYADVRYNFYGIGEEAGEAGVSELTKQKGFGALGEGLFRFHGLWYAGARYRLLDTTTSLRDNPEFDNSVVNPDELDVRIAELGPRVTRDSRDDEDYPRTGSLFNGRIGFNGSAVGGQLAYQTYDIDYAKYMSVASNQVLAVRGAGCFVQGSEAPFYDLCLLSATENLRGYRASRYRDNAMIAAQAEYRYEVYKRLALVAFGGGGNIAPSLSDLKFSDILPGGGAGLRYRITPESHVNLSVDYAWGKASHQLYFFIGEAF